MGLFPPLPPLPGRRLFTAGLLLAALLAMLHAPARMAGLPASNVTGGIDDQGAEGHWLMARLLRGAGHPVLGSLSEAVNSDERVVVVVDGASLVLCGRGLEALERLLETGRVAGVVAAAGDGACLERLAELLSHGAGGVEAYHVGEIGAALAYSTRIVLYRPLDLQASRPWSRLGAWLGVYPDSATVGGPGVAGVFNGVPAVLLGGEAFSNRVLAASIRAGYGNHLLLLRLAEALGGPGAPVAFAAEFHPPRDPAAGLAARLDPGAVLLSVLNALHGVELAAVDALRSNVPALAVYLAAAGLMVYALARRAGGMAEDAVEEVEPWRGPVRMLGVSPLLNRLSRGEGLTAGEARRAVLALWELLDLVARGRLGVGAGELAGRPELLEGLGLDPGEAGEALSRLAVLREKALGRRRLRPPLVLPFLLTWERRLLQVLPSVEPLFEALGASLRESRRGVERVLASQHR